MLEPRKSVWAERLFALYNRNLLRRRFAALRVAGLEHLRQRSLDAPLILYANHSSWWDGLVAFALGRAAQLDHYFLMEERQLRQYQLFRRLGAFSVVREDARAALVSINYAADLLRDTDRALWIFPQGDTLPNDTRPLKLYTGAARIIRRCERAYVAPVALRYEFLEDFKPEIFARIGALELLENNPNPKRLTQQFTANLTDTLDKLRQDILATDWRHYEKML